MLNVNLTKGVSHSALLTAVTEARSIAASANTSEINASTSATEALASQNEAASSSTSATISKNEAAISATDSANSASDSADSASAASTSESNAANSASAANTSATNAAESELTVEGYAYNAATSETNASTSEVNAATSAAEALSSQNAAASSASSALTAKNVATASEANAAISESNASTSESNASTSASTATTQAGIATTQAGIATSEASDATTSASTATTQAGIATSQATTATTQAGIATAQATNAASSATEAQASASTATTKASEASTSAAEALASELAAAAIVTEPLVGAIGNINNPLLDLPLNNSLAMKQGVGSVTFERSTTATYINRYGVLQTASIDEPRFEKEGLLIEGASTNVLLQTGYVGAGTETPPTSWIIAFNTGSTIARASAIDATKLTVVQSGTAQREFLEQIRTLTGGVTYTLSVWFEADTIASGIILGVANMDGGYTGSRSLEGASVTGAGRYSITFTPATTEEVSIRVGLGCSANSTGTVSHCLPQLEALPFATSYIPTTTTAVTRAGETCDISAENGLPVGLNLSLSADITCKADSTSGLKHAICYIADSTNYPNTRILCFHKYSTGFMQFYAGATKSVSEVDYFSEKYRITFSVDNTSGVQNLYQDGILKDTDSLSGTNEISTIDTFQLGRWVGYSYLYGHIKNFRVWDKALSSSEASLA